MLCSLVEFRREAKMLKSLARGFEFKETSISKKTLRRILILMVLSLPTWPIMMLDIYGILPDNVFGHAAIALMFIGAISMMCFVCTRFVNRFYFPNKYLDEWEVKIKNESMAFAFMVMAWGLVPIALTVMIILDFTMTSEASLTMSVEAIIIWFAGFLLIMLYLQTFHALWQVRPIDEE